MEVRLNFIEYTDTTNSILLLLVIVFRLSAKGLALRAWNYVKDIGINTEEAYPYQGEVFKRELFELHQILLFFSLN